MEQSSTDERSGTQDAATEAELVAGPEVAPPPLDDDEDVVDAEIVESSMFAPLPLGGLSTDYNDAGVPSLDYLRDKIEGRHATAIGSTELAEAAAAREAAARRSAQEHAALLAEQQHAAREQAGKDKLEEIRRSMRPQG